MTPISAPVLEQKLRTDLSATHVEVVDTSGGCGQSFAALIVSDAFTDKPLLARHRLVNALVRNEVATIHAWTPRCLTVAQWEAERGA